jgi:hypothetical protein
LPYYIRGNEPAFLYTREILKFFHGNRASYAKFIREGLNQDTKTPILQQAFSRRLGVFPQNTETPGISEGKGIKGTSGVPQATTGAGGK